MSWSARNAAMSSRVIGVPISSRPRNPARHEPHGGLSTGAVMRARVQSSPEVVTASLIPCTSQRAGDEQPGGGGTKAVDQAGPVARVVRADRGQGDQARRPAGRTSCSSPSRRRGRRPAGRSPAASTDPHDGNPPPSPSDRFQVGAPGTVGKRTACALQNDHPVHGSISGAGYLPHFLFRRFLSDFFGHSVVALFHRSLKWAL